MNYVTPTNYLELVQGYMKMLQDHWVHQKVFFVTGGGSQPSGTWDYHFGKSLKWVNTNGIAFWGFSANSPPILEPILVGIGMFTGGMGF